MNKLLSNAEWKKLEHLATCVGLDDRNHDPAMAERRRLMLELVSQVQVMRMALPHTADGEAVLPGQMVYSCNMMDLPPWHRTPGKHAAIAYRYVEAMPRDISTRYYSTPELAEANARDIGGPDIVCVRHTVNVAEKL